MNRTFHAILRSISNKSSMKSNVISTILANYPDFDLSKKEQIFEKIYPLYLSHKKEDKPIFEIIDNNKEKFKGVQGDYRIKRLELSNIGGFPSSAIPFGLDLNKDGKPCSAIILGSNGTGKSSIFDSVEYSFCRRVGEVELRYSNDGIEDESIKFEKYLSHLNSNFSESVCRLETMNGAYNIHDGIFDKQTRRILNPNTHFISDYDIYEKGKLNYLGNDPNSFHHIIAQNMGLNELLELDQNLLRFLKYDRKKNKIELGHLNKELKGIEENIDLWKTNIASNLVEIDKLKSSGITKTNARSIDLSSLENTSYKIVEIGNVEINESIDNFLESYFALVSSKNTSKNNELEFLSLGKEILDNFENCPLCEDSKLGKDEIRKRIISRINKTKEVSKLRLRLKTAQNDILLWVGNMIRNFNSAKRFLESDKKKLREFPQFSSLLLYVTNAINELDIVLEALKTDGVEYQDIETKQSLFRMYLEVRLRPNINPINKLIRTLKKLNNKKIESINDYRNKDNDIDQINYKSQIRECEIENNTLQKNIEVSTNRLEEIKNEINYHENLINEFAVIKNQFVEYQKEIETVKNREVGSAFEPIRNIVCEILNSYLIKENRNVRLEVKLADLHDEETGEKVSEKLLAHIVSVDKKNQFSISPNKYFNTFHYRLFCSMIGISIAVASRKKSGINMPLILDDIFYASDFENRNSLEGFLIHLFDSFEKYTPNLPLQLIMFTHDEMIFECVNNLSRSMNNDTVIAAKLFHHSQSKYESNFKDLIYKFSEIYNDNQIKEILN